MKNIILILGVILISGTTVFANCNSLEECRENARYGNANGEYDMGALYEMGKFVTKNYKTAIEWYEKAASHGNVDAQYTLGCMYQWGGTEDLERSVKFYGMSARNGYPHSAYQLAKLYRYGGGGAKQSDENALMYYIIAHTEDGYDGAIEDIGEIEQRMSLAEIQRAEKKADWWMNKYRGKTYLWGKFKRWIE